MRPWLTARWAPATSTAILMLSTVSRAQDAIAEAGETRDARGADALRQEATPAGASSVAQTATSAPPIEFSVSGERAESESASRSHQGYQEIQLRPRRTQGDLLETVPGLFAVQHAGGGKANQWFLRGFDADHGTDIAFFVDGVPVNLVSHAHGQGYSDVHFLIPELVTAIDGYKGPYYASFGDFATAGAVNVSLAQSLPESRIEGAYGQYGIRRGLAIESPTLGERTHAVFAGEIGEDDGPFENPERLRRYNLFARVTRDLTSSSSVSLTWLSYGSSWHGSGQIPARAVCGEGEAQNPPPEVYGASCLSRFGAVDPSEGGSSQRHQASLRYSALGTGGDLSLLLYLVRYRFSLFSNFTFFLDDPIRGDEIEQDDDRTVLGADWRLSRRVELGPIRIKTTLGLQVRSDSIDNALWHDAQRERLAPRVLAGINESEFGIFAEADARVTRAVRFIWGLRGDRIDVAVDNHLAALASPDSGGSGTKGSQLVSPKLMAVLSPASQVDLFAAYGRGFHSNDARGVTLASGAATLITPALGYEVGTRVSPTEGLTLESSAFLLDLASELVWSGDTGGTEPSGSTRRYGLELGGRYRVGSWLFADANATFVRARFRENAGNGNAVALAPTRTLTVGLAVRQRFGDLTPFAALHLKALADRPATPDGSLIAQGFTTLDANVGARWQALELAVDVQNVLDASYREVSFANESRLPYEPRPVSGIHYTPGWPRTATLRAALYWK
ncbi:MAG TPA: TonB-dependent receptor [Polyangiaceae bacterium]|jgi:outer membrane receptor for Fe3+-dicitrate